MDIMEDEDIFNDDLDIFDIIDYGFPRRLYERSHHFQMMDNLTFFKRFRLEKDTVLQLLERIQPHLEVPMDLNNRISPINQLLTCLRFYSSAGHLSSIADFAGMSIPSVSRIIKRVSEAIASLYPQCVKMPEGPEIIRCQNKFYQIASFPRVLGVVDGTHIKIQSPGGDDAEVFRNRKSYFSINVQAAGTADLKFSNIVARWPGSAHDSTIFSNSNLRASFEAGMYPNCVLLGDSGYPLRDYFYTPLGNPVNREQQLYNEAHIRTRNCIERLFGVWKRRFPVLAYGLRLKLETTLTIIIATGVLHNIAIEMHEPEPPLPDEIDMEDLNYLMEIGQIEENIHENHGLAINGRANLINNYFANL